MCRGFRRSPSPPFQEMVRARPECGYSLLEALTVLAIVATCSALAALNIRPVLHDFQVNGAYGAALTAMRQARQSSVAERRVYVVTFVSPGTILVQRREQDGRLTTTGATQLTFGMQFRAEPGIPTAAAQTPDHFGTGAVAIDFNGSNQVYFQPDGSAQDSANRESNGVVYLARPGDISSARAITLFGSTGRTKGWRLSVLAWRWI
jgi:Tfp pilus assembly protein FimT